MTDYTELLLQVSDVMRKHNRVVYRGINSILPPPMTDEEAVKAIRDIVTLKGKWIVDDEWGNCHCSVCKFENNRQPYYCEECGAYMEGEKI